MTQTDGGSGQNHEEKGNLRFFYFQRGFEEVPLWFVRGYVWKCHEKFLTKCWENLYVVGIRIQQIFELGTGTFEEFPVDFRRSKFQVAP